MRANGGGARIKLDKRTVFSAIVLLVMLALIVLLCVRLWPLMVQVVKNAGDEGNMTSYIDDYGAQGVAELAGLSALQVIVTVLPSAAIQVLAGLCYGVWLGMLVCLAGQVLGNAAVFLALRQFGRVLGPLLRPKPKPKGAKHRLLSLETLRGLQRPALVAFCLFLLPGIPNGILPYLFAQTKIKFWRYILSIVSASVPSMLVCTLIGDRLAKGDYRTAVLVAVALLGVLALVLVFRKRIMRFVEQHSKESKAPAA